MDGHSRKPIAQGVLYLAAVGASFSLPFTAQAADISTYECSLSSDSPASGLSTCNSGGTGGGYLTSVNRITGFSVGDPKANDPNKCHDETPDTANKYCGLQAKGTAVAPIGAWG